MLRYLIAILYVATMLSCSTTEKQTTPPTTQSKIDKEAYFDPLENLDKLSEYTSPKLIDPTSARVNYSVDARREGIQGRIILKLFIDENGTVRDVEIEQSLNRSLDKNAVETFRNAKFHPATLNGKPVKSIFKMPIDYKLDRSQ